MIRKPWPFEPVVRDVVDQLAAGRYADLERRTRGARLSAIEIAEAVREYGRNIIPPSEQAGLALDVVPIANSEPAAWSVDVSLCTTEELKSDLTLQLTIRAALGDEFDVEIDGLHVL